MRGELDFEQSLRARVALLAGLPDVRVVDQVRARGRLTPGARTLVRTLKRLGYQFAIVSGGFTQITDELVADLGIDYSAANTLEIVDGRLTGGSIGPRSWTGRARPTAAGAVRRPGRRAAGPDRGDRRRRQRPGHAGAAGLGVAFNAKPVVREAADTAVNVPFLDAILYLLGITREEVEAADAEAGLETPAPPVGPAA